MFLSKSSPYLNKNYINSKIQPQIFNSHLILTTFRLLLFLLLLYQTNKHQYKITAHSIPISILLPLPLLTPKKTNKEAIKLSNNNPKIPYQKNPQTIPNIFNNHSNNSLSLINL